VVEKPCCDRITARDLFNDIFIFLFLFFCTSLSLSLRIA
jgi:hypothetical protein